MELKRWKPVVLAERVPPALEVRRVVEPAHIRAAYGGFCLLLQIQLGQIRRLRAFPGKKLLGCRGIHRDRPDARLRLRGLQHAIRRVGAPDLELAHIAELDAIPKEPQNFSSAHSRGEPNADRHDAR